MNPLAKEFISKTRDYTVYKWTVGYRDGNGNGRYYYYVQNYDFNVTKYNVISFVDDLIANRDNNYTVKNTHYKSPDKSIPNIWLIIDFHEKKYEATFRGEFHNISRALHTYMTRKGYERSINRSPNNAQ